MAAKSVTLSSVLHGDVDEKFSGMNYELFESTFVFRQSGNAILRIYEKFSRSIWLPASHAVHVASFFALHALKLHFFAFRRTGWRKVRVYSANTLCLGGKTPTHVPRLNSQTFIAEECRKLIGSSFLKIGLTLIFAVSFFIPVVVCFLWRGPRLPLVVTTVCCHDNSGECHCQYCK